MSYLKYPDYYRQLLLADRLPMPYPNQSAYVHSAPNLCNQNCGIGKVNLQNGSWDPIANDAIYPWHQHYNSYFLGNIGETTNLFTQEPNTDCDYYNGMIPYQDPSYALNFIKIKLTSNFPTCAKNLDPNLLDPWEILIVNDVMWVASCGSGLITSYNLLGLPLYPPVNVFGPCCSIGHPTGIVSNCNMNAFPLVKGPVCEMCSIIVATRDGTINGYNFDIDNANSAILLDNSLFNCVYTGLELVNDILYVVDFFNQCIDVYDSSFIKVMPCSFIDKCLDDPIPCDFAPYNIINIGDVLYVTYAKQNPLDNQYELLGPGNGYINIFTLDGIFIKRFASRGFLNTPWGISLAPSNFGYPAGSLMVSNFGSNTIDIYDPCGNYLGKIKDKGGIDICIEGVRGLTINPIHDKILYWTSRGNNLKEASVGSINTFSSC